MEQLLTAVIVAPFVIAMVGFATNFVTLVVAPERDDLRSNEPTPN